MKKIMWLLLIFAAVSCKEYYQAPKLTPTSGFLVIEGVINNGPGPTSIRLTRSTELTDRKTVIEAGAIVQVEPESGGGAVTLPHTGNGYYTHLQLTLNNALRYRLRIRTSLGSEYVSEYQKPKITPPIDSITWKRENGVTLYINAHDDQNLTRFYKWEYVETWEFHSAYTSNLVYRIYTTQPPFNQVRYEVVDFDPVTHAINEKIFKCWQNQISTQIKVGSTEKLSADKVYLPIVNIEQNSWKLSQLYSIFVRQTALTKEGYDFFERMKKNSESLGSVFDPQPSQLNGNIRCVTNPAEIVIGFIEIASITEKRIFIKNSEVAGWRFTDGCVSPTSHQNVNDSIQVAYFAGLLPIGVNETFPSGAMKSFFAAPAICVDCTLRGFNTKPSFWP